MKILSVLLGMALGCAVFAEEMTVAVRLANVRNKPSTQGNKIRSLKQGETVQVKTVKDGWAELENKGGFVSASLLKKKEAGIPAAKAASSAAEKPTKKTAAKDNSGMVNIPASGKKDQPFSDLPVIPGSGKPATEKGMLYPMKGKGNVRYALLRVMGSKYVVACFVHAGKKDVLKPFANKEVKLVGSWYKVSGWKHPVMQVRSCKELSQD